MALNLGRASVTWPLPDLPTGGRWRSLLGTLAGASDGSDFAARGELGLGPDEARILEAVLTI